MILKFKNLFLISCAKYVEINNKNKKNVMVMGGEQVRLLLKNSALVVNCCGTFLIS